MKVTIPKKMFEIKEATRKDWLNYFELTKGRMNEEEKRKFILKHLKGKL